MDISWIGVMLETFLIFFILSNEANGKALLDKGKQYYSAMRNLNHPVYDSSYSVNPKLFYTPQIDGQPIYIPAISGSEHVNKFLDDYYKINRDYSQSWTLAPPVTHDYDITSESSYYENGETSYSMVKNFLEEKYKDGVYNSYILPTTAGSLLKHEVKTTDRKGIEHKVPVNKKIHNSNKKRPQAASTEIYFTQYKLKNGIPEDSPTELTKVDHEKQEKSPTKSDASGVDDYNEMDNISTFELKKDKKCQPVKHKNKCKSESVTKSSVEDYMTNSIDLEHSKNYITTETLKYSSNKIENKVSAGKHKPEVDAINKLYDDDYEPEIVDKINEVYYEPEVVNIINKDKNIMKIPETTRHFESEDNGGSTVNFSSKKDKIKNGFADSKTKKDKTEKGKHQSVKVSKKPNKDVKDSASDDMNLYKPEIVQILKDNSKKYINKLPSDSYKPNIDQVKLSDDDYEPEVVDVVNKLSDNYMETYNDASELSDVEGFDSEVDIINDENDILDTSVSEKDKAKPNKQVKNKENNKKIDKYNKSEVKPNSKVTKPLENESKSKYQPGHVMEGKNKVSLADKSVVENQSDDLKEIHSRNLVNQHSQEIEEFDGSGSQTIDESMRRIPQFLNADSIRNLTSLNTNIWSLIFNPNAERNELKRCVTRSNETGICMYVQHCDVPNIATSLEQLLNNACVIDDVFIGVCCPEFPVQTVKVHWDEIPSNSDKQSEDEFGHSADDCGIRSDDAEKTDSWPWQAPLVSMSNGKVFCGGVVINDDYILTAAHCTTKIPKNQILVRLGQHDETSGDDFAVIEIKRHAQYNPRTMHNDIALLKLGKRIMRGEHTAAVCLSEDDDDHEDEKAILLGRKGSFSQSSKQIEWLKVMSNSDCEKKLGSKVPATLLCTDARDENERTCNLDSGAPLVIEDDGKYEVIGILSWNRNDCDDRFPSTFSRVSKYVRWIQKHAV